MPELPEVESTRKVLLPILLGNTLHHATIHQPKLRYPVILDNAIFPFTIKDVKRRAKYLMLLNEHDHVIVIHLGMSGYLSIQPSDTPQKKHGHVVFTLNKNQVMIFNDTRRIGLIQWFPNREVCRWFQHLGPEPLDVSCTIDLLWTLSQKAKTPIKTFIMNQKNIVGVGNIYASESLFLSGIHPLTPAHLVTYAQLNALLTHIKSILNKAITMGGTTLKDYQSPDAKPGYFQQTLHVYNRQHQPCHQCQTTLHLIKINQRQSVFCPQCQPALSESS